MVDAYVGAGGCLCWCCSGGKGKVGMVDVMLVLYSSSTRLG